MNPQTVTEMQREEILMRYADGQREFDDLEFTNYLYLDKCQLAGICFRNCWMDGTFEGSNLENADFSNSCIKTVEFTNANLKNAIFCGSEIDAIRIQGADLNGADFEGATAHAHTYSKGEKP